MLLIPDPNTAVMDPFRQHPTLNINCFVPTRSPASRTRRDPRYIAKKAEEYLKGTGIADTAYFGPEAEFYIFDDVRFDQNQYSGYYFLDSRKACGTPGTRARRPPNLGYKPRYKEGYFPVPPMDQYQDLRVGDGRSMLELRRASRPRCSTTRSAPRGQAEIDMRFDTLLTHGRQADALQVRDQERRVAAGQVGHVHAEADLPGQRLGHALPPVAVEGRRAAVLRREGLRRPVRHRPLVHRRPAHARARRSSRSPTRPRTRTSDSCRATRRRSTWCTRSATARRPSASRCTRRARRPSASSSGAPTRRATRTSRSRR